MRIAIAISVLVTGWAFAPVRADDAPLVQYSIGSHVHYVVPEAVASAHDATMLASMPRMEKIEGYWTPNEAQVIVAERVFRELLHDAQRDPTLIFPNLNVNAADSSDDSVVHQQNELALVIKNYENYIRQYVGIMVEGRKIVFCNYSDVPRIDPATHYFYLEEYFDPKETVHFLQGQVDIDWKSASNVAIIGSWEPKKKR